MKLHAPTLRVVAAWLRAQASRRPARRGQTFDLDPIDVFAFNAATSFEHGDPHIIASNIGIDTGDAGWTDVELFEDTP